MTRQIFFDTETTGLDADKGDRIIEIGCLEMVDRRLTGNNLHLYLNPERSSHPDAVKIHGLTDEFLADKPRFDEVAEQLLGFLQGAELIIHNAAFDVAFVNAELKRLNRGVINDVVAKVTDSLLMARDKVDRGDLKIALRLGKGAKAEGNRDRESAGLHDQRARVVAQREIGGRGQLQRDAIGLAGSQRR